MLRLLVQLYGALLYTGVGSLPEENLPEDLNAALDLAIKLAGKPVENPIHGGILIFNLDGQPCCLERA